MGEWPRQRLGDVLELVIDHRGKTPKKLGSDWAESGHRVISAINVKNSRINDNDHHYVDDKTYAKWMKEPLTVGDVILTSEAPLGHAAFIDEPCGWALGQRVFALRASRKVLDGRFLYYYLQTPVAQAELAGRATGTTVLGIKQSELVHVSVPTPDLKVQSAISGMLKSLDVKLETNRQIVKTARNLALAMVREASGGKLAEIQDFAVHRREQRMPTDEGSREVWHYSLPAFDQGQHPLREHSEAIKSSKFLVDKPSVLFSKLNPHTPRVWLAYPDSAGNSYASTEFVVLQPRDVSPEILWLACAQNSVCDDLAVMARGTSNSHQRVSPSDILTSNVIDLNSLPSAVIDQCENLIQLTKGVQKEISGLVALRETLLPNFMDGSLTVRAAEDFVSDVV